MADDKSDKPPVIINNTINGIFGTNKQYLNSTKTQLKGGKSQKSPQLSELPLAATTVLIEIGKGGGQNLPAEKYNEIVLGVQRVFGSKRENISALVNQANLALARFQSTSRYLELLRDNMEPQDKDALLQVIEELVKNPSSEDSLGVYLAQKAQKYLKETTS